MSTLIRVFPSCSEILNSNFPISLSWKYRVHKSRSDQKLPNTHYRKIVSAIRHWLGFFILMHIFINMIFLHWVLHFAVHFVATRIINNVVRCLNMLLYALIFHLKRVLISGEYNNLLRNKFCNAKLFKISLGGTGGDASEILQLIGHFAPLSSS